jgi:hypothetical protein
MHRKNLKGMKKRLLKGEKTRGEGNNVKENKSKK